MASCIKMQALCSGVGQTNVARLWSLSVVVLVAHQQGVAVNVTSRKATHTETKPTSKNTTKTRTPNKHSV